MPVEKFSKTKLAWIGIVVIIDWFSRSGQPPAWWLSKRFQPVRWMVYGWGVWLCLKNLNNGSDFIYFQF